MGLSVTCMCLWVSVSGTRALFTGKMFLYVAASISSAGMFVCEGGVFWKDHQKVWDQKQSPPCEGGHADPGPPSP